MYASARKIIQFPLLDRICREIIKSGDDELEAVDKELEMVNATIKSLNRKRRILLVLYKQALRERGCPPT